MPLYDQITISNLSLHLPRGLGPSAFSLDPPPPCPADLSLEISVQDHVFPSCVADDTQGGLGIDYSSLSKEILALCDQQTWERPEALLEDVGRLVMQKDTVEGLDLCLELPRASLKASRVVYSGSLARSSSSTTKSTWTCKIRDLKVQTLIGLRSYERQHKQWLELDVAFQEYERKSWNHVAAAEEIYSWVDRSEYGTIEALAENLAIHLFSTLGPLHPSAAAIDITLRKPSALPFAVPGLSIHRTRASFISRQESPSRIFVALGSNLGDRLDNISRAVSALSATDLEIVHHSKLYESEPMYHEDQGRFINAVIEIQSTLSPLDLLKRLKAVEREVGRVKTFRNGPRTVDLDLLLYGDEIISIGEIDAAEDKHGIGWLRCPHPRIAEREFVLRPLADLAPNLRLPNNGRTVNDLLHAHSVSTLAPLLPFPSPCLPLRFDGRPRIMQIFNATPDSFSDGSQSATDPVLALQKIETLFNHDFAPDILDIGGQSTRPGAIMCTPLEEAARVIPLIKAIRSSDHPLLRMVPISIDTFRPEVARAALEAGASCINDVRGGTEPGMLQVMAELNVPVILMHSRGDSTSMTLPSAKDYSALGGVVSGVKAELGEMVRRALQAGVKAWNIIIDPGLGFAKGTEQNLKLLAHLPEVVATGSPLHGYPLLIGGSRKRFVGEITKRAEPNERVFGDAGVAGWCLGSGVVDILRVHEGRGMAEMVKMWTMIQGDRADE